jgi:hypothetical protein
VDHDEDGVMCQAGSQMGASRLRLSCDSPTVYKPLHELDGSTASGKSSLRFDQISQVAVNKKMPRNFLTLNFNI